MGLFSATEIGVDEVQRDYAPILTRGAKAGRARAIAAGVSLAIALAASPARSEPLYMFWRLVPENTSSSPIPLHEVFSKQRAIPVAAIRLQEPVTIEHPRNPPERETIPAGTLFQLVANDDGKVGYCPVPQRRRLNPRGSLVNWRTCLTDRDGDGRFDASFVVDHRRVGLPSVAGSINRARPLATTPAYIVGEPRDYPVNITLELSFRGSGDGMSVQTSFSETIVGDAYWRQPGVRINGDMHFRVANSSIVVRNVVGRQVAFEIIHHDVGLFTDHRHRLVTTALPASVRAVLSQ